MLLPQFFVVSTARSTLRNRRARRASEAAKTSLSRWLRQRLGRNAEAAAALSRPQHRWHELIRLICVSA